MKSIIDRHQSKSLHGHLRRSAMNRSEQSLDTLWTRLDVAESAVISLERENEQLRTERARAVLAAAQATAVSKDKNRPATNESRSKFEALTQEFRIAEAARAEAARERHAAIEAVSEALKEEYSQQITTIQEMHANELAALPAMAEKQARQAVAEELDALSAKASTAKQDLIIANRERKEDLRVLEEMLKKKYSAQIEALHRHYATTLEKLSMQKKEQFATELVSSLSSAHDAWQEDTAKQLRRATETAAKAVNDERTRWQRRKKRTLGRAARVWRRRERSRLIEARDQWKSVHRRAIDACNARWKTKFERFRKQAHLISTFSHASAVVWEHIKLLIRSLTSQKASTIGGAGFQTNYSRPKRMQAGLMAALLIFLGVSFSLTAGLPTSSNSPTSVAPDKKALSVPQNASVPAGKSVEAVAAEAVFAKQITPGRSSSVKVTVSPNPAFNRADSPSQESVGHAGKTKRSMEQHSVRNTIVRPDKRITERMIRERLQKNIRLLRMERTAN